ncbi:MAG: hypothetical protein C0598_01775 [Marinilabiliales bacterium]|nr:MAG: hypothetical protein C0598_01775 [Marinilabiliales bacterium]
MQTKAKTVEEYIANIPDERREAIVKLRKVVLENLPEGFVEEMNYGMIGYVVPHSIYPDGYHCAPELPLPFANIANQKNHIGFYHMGVYADPDLNKWFTQEYAKVSKYKLDMGKSCIRYKNPDRITYELIGELMQKMSVEDWIKLYEKNYKK